MAKLLDIGTFPTRHTVDNEPLDGHGPLLALTNPKDGSAVASFAAVTPAEVDAAVAGAQRALDGVWGTFAGAQRARCLHALADLIDEYAAPIAYFESVCSGRPVAQVEGEMAMVSGVFRYYAGWADKIKGDAFVADDGFYKIVRHEPLGVCAGITAWNGSLHFLAWKAAPALACGNAVVIKPSEKSPLGTLAVGRLVAAAGFPAGALQVVAGGAAVGAHLAAHMGVHKISFTGSGAAGRAIQDAATRSNLKRVTLELGGKSPAIVFADADLDAALFWCVLAITTNAGQVCAATSRLLVQASVADAFVARLRARFAEIAAALGADPQDRATTYGPLVDAAQFARVAAYLPPGTPTAGLYVAPALVVDPPTDAPVYRDEVFGPVLCVHTFATEADAVAMANDTEYGLAAAVYTRSLNRALRVSARLRAGTVGVNCASVVGPQVPMGGFGSSGVGRELGEYALRHYTEPKAIWINMAGKEEE